MGTRRSINCLSRTFFVHQKIKRVWKSLILRFRISVYLVSGSSNLLMRMEYMPEPPEE
uniref:Uncharacterized protein n=1 Tax=Arundo donax TaxID=35708 RepID=A0A0A8YDJ4_ARUDO